MKTSDFPGPQAQHELRAVAVAFLLLAQHRAGVGAFLGEGALLPRRLLVPLDEAAFRRGKHALEDHEKPGSAAIDDPDLLEDGKKLRGVLEGNPGGLHQELQVALDRDVLPRLPVGDVASLADDGEDRALDGVVDDAVGDLLPVPEGEVEVMGARLLLAAERLGEAAEDLARDRARVPAGTSEDAVGEGEGDRPDGVVPLVHDLLHPASEGEVHVHPGVPVRHGEDVQLVDLRIMVI